MLGGRLARGKLRKKSQVSENDEVLGGRLARDSPGTCVFLAKCLVVVWRDVHLGLVIFQPSVRGRLARE